MDWYKDTLQIRTRGKGLYPLTGEVEKLLHSWNVQDGCAGYFAYPFEFMANCCAKTHIPHLEIAKNGNNGTLGE